MRNGYTLVLHFFGENNLQKLLENVVVAVMRFVVVATWVSKLAPRLCL